MRLRYILGGDRPSQTTRLALFSTRIHGMLLEAQYVKGGISKVGSTTAAAMASKPPTYSERNAPNSNTRL